MGQFPAYIFIVRHGNRLDAADKDWHLSSPTPYDPPLTYSGWQQSKALGDRIGDILRARIAQDEATRTSQTKNGPGLRRKQYRVVIHSSPFLRCVQTSTAISAGLRSSPSTFSPTSSPAEQRDATFQKPVLRLDAFLGEWLNPDYYELITPPPGSVMMVASAKAELLRRENYGAIPHFQHHHVHSHSSPNPSMKPSTGNHLWASPSPHKPTTIASSGLDNMTDMASALPVPGKTADEGYVSPTPAFALSKNAPIPAGFVAHARDACLDVDYLWDSMRKPYAWGDGGEYGEEWSAMHKRFRNGVQMMVEWYAGAEHPAQLVANATKSRQSSFVGGKQAAVAATLDGDDDEVDEENIVILVSHGAGCNALIGAITNQPVLADVAMTSLTSFERKSQPSIIDASLPPTPQLSPTDAKPSLPLHKHYNLTLFASTDHLRSASHTPKSTRPSAMASALSGSLCSNGFRKQYSNSFSSGLGTWASSNHNAFAHAETATPVCNGKNSPRTSAIRAFRSGVNTSRVTRAGSVASNPSPGLWSPAVRFEEAMEDEEEFDMLLDFPDTKSSEENEYNHTNGNSIRNVAHSDNEPPMKREDRTIPTTPAKSPQAETEEVDGLSSLRVGAGVGGLWGQPKLSPEIERIRGLASPKRRWTVSERA